MSRLVNTARCLFVATGVAMIAAAAYAVLIKMGLQSLSDPAVAIVIAMAAGLIVGAIGVAQALEWRRSSLLWLLVACMVAAEAYGALLTAERIVTQRDEAEAPLRQRKTLHDMALRDLAAAKTARPEPVDRTEVLAAERRKSEAEQASREDASKPGCRISCKEMHDAAIARAEEALRVARTALNAKELAETNSIADAIRRAEAALADNPAPRSASPLADLLGVSPDRLTLAFAVLGTVGVNLLACALIFAGVHGPGGGGSHIASPPAATATLRLLPDASVEATAQVLSFKEAPTKAAPRKPSGAAAQVVHLDQGRADRRNSADMLDQIARFGLEVLKPGDCDTPVTAIRQQYHEWCQAKGLTPASDADLHTALIALFKRARIEVGKVDGVWVAHGVKLVDAARVA